MKKSVLIGLMVLAAAAAGAQNINLGSFPLGQWVDTNFNAVWEFKSDNIRILDLNGTELYNFSQQGIEGFQVSAGMSGPSISFSSTPAARKYTISKPLTNENLVLEIRRSGQSDYRIEMKPKK